VQKIHKGRFGENGFRNAVLHRTRALLGALAGLQKSAEMTSALDDAVVPG
jgi:hypothetical protein